VAKTTYILRQASTIPQVPTPRAPRPAAEIGQKGRLKAVKGQLSPVNCPPFAARERMNSGQTPAPRADRRPPPPDQVTADN
jgi:hypothetical protein